MSRVFADACYWIALINRDDELRAAALAAQQKAAHATVFTTDEVLGEVLNYFSKWGPSWRKQAVQIIEGIRGDRRVVVDEQSRATFDGGFVLFKSRGDKHYSLVDCVSFLAMTRHGITVALTNDHHFEQEGLSAKLRAVES
ncbi:MAG: PIN domain-containing protein [Phycisphaerales bacterium]|nr:PIN domain-containing protein [Phycisphaerales bacterium]